MPSIQAHARRLTEEIRSVLWWNHLVSPLAGILYSLWWFGVDHLQQPVQTILLFSCSLFGTASFGYWLNDLTDQSLDQRVGKSNATLRYSTSVNLTIAGFLLLVGAWPWYYLVQYSVGFYAWLGVFITLLLYSVPPFRLKERGLAGVLCDAGYGHLLPVWIVLGIFASPEITASPDWTVWAFLGSLLLLIKGLRNICLHQLEDRHRDRKAGVQTFVLRWGPKRTASLISWLFLPMEGILLLILAIVVHPVFLAGLLFFLFTYALRVWSWKFYRSYSERMVYRLWYVLNDFYEGTFPLLALGLVLFHKPWLGWLLPVHVFLFPRALNHWRWVWDTWKNLTFWIELRKYIL